MAIARAVVLEPPLVLMDEPLSNLDAALRLEMRTEIRRIHQELKLTTVYVTHDQEEALSLADRLVVLRDGKVSQIGTPAELYERPASAYVAGFMGYRNILRLPLGDLAAETPEQDPAPAVAAIRPEDLDFVGSAQTAPADSLTLDGVVLVVEYHGREYLAQVEIPDGRRLYVRTSQRPAPGERVTLAAPRSRVLLFPDESGAS